MARITSSVAALAFLAAAACGAWPPDSSQAYKPGYGVVDSVKAVGAGVPPGRTTGRIVGSPAAAGGATIPPARPAGSLEGYQLTLRMDDGTLQTITQTNRDFRVGDRVQVTSDGRVVRL